MDAIGKIVATMLANTVQDESGKVEKKDKMSASEMRGMEVNLRSLMKTWLGPEDTWIVTQAKRKREKEDVYKNYPGLDPVFMKIWSNEIL